VSKSNRIVVGAVAALSVVSLAASWGCQGTTRQGTLYSVQIDRELETFLASDLETVHRAALEVVQTDFGYTLTEEALDAREGIIRARTARDNLVRIETFKHGEGVTRVQVYVGARDAETAGREVLGAIETRLAAP
jgi:hypothetical protein